MTAKSALVTVIILLIAGLCYAGNVIFYDENGNPISESQYREKKLKRTEQLDKQKKKVRKALSAKKDKHGRQLYDSEGNRIYYHNIDHDPSNTQTNKKAVKPQKKSKKKFKQEYDQYGRPLYDKDGNIITYQYWVAAKWCEACGVELAQSTRAGQKCPKCGKTWQWPKEARIIQKGIKE